MTEIVNVDLGERSYDISIGTELPIGEALGNDVNISALVISDSNVTPLYMERCVALLEARGLTVASAVVKAGELSKSLECAAELYGKAVDAGLDRKSVIVALGGGVVGDLAGFVAATFLRGVKFLQVPTSLLAMVDSSVGGKTAVDLPQGKNLVGAFYQPVEVVVDLDTLDTLPEREYISGLGEVIKYGMIWDEKLFEYFEQNIDAMLNRDKAVVQYIVKRCCEIKAEVVAEDEREGGLRAILNFGHTFAHALEAVSGYDKWLHGEAVSLGMIYAARLSIDACGFADNSAERLITLLDKLGLPVKLDDIPDWAEIKLAMAADKKTVNAVPRFVLAEKVGKVKLGCEISEELLKSQLVGM
jgi:3-dehydroquinate synthase